MCANYNIIAMKSASIQRMCFFGTVLLLACGDFVFGQDVVFHLLEGDQLGREVGNVADEAGLNNIAGEQDFAHLRYSFLTTQTPHYNYFSINNQTSVLTTNQAIDRETLCEFTNVCFIKLNIAVQSMKSSFFQKELQSRLTELEMRTPAIDTHFRVTKSCPMTHHSKLTFRRN